MFKFTAKICENCYQINKDTIDSIFSNHYKVRSWHSCNICKENTHWEFSSEFKIKNEFEEAKEKYQSLLN
jgi:protein-arginine kinase activator protein McsA